MLHVVLSNWLSPSTAQNSDFQSLLESKLKKISISPLEMEALNSIGVKPLPLLAEQREPHNKPPLLTVAPFKDQSSSSCRTSKCGHSSSRTLNGGIVLLSSFLSCGLAQALTDDEALQQSPISDFDVGGALDSVIRFAAENPIIAGGGAAVVAVPFVVAQLLSKAKPWGVESAEVAYARLGDDANAQLLDIRPTAEIKEAGRPNIRGLKKKTVAVAYNGDDKLGFLRKLNSKFKEPQNTSLFILDKFDGNSELVAKLVTSNGFKAAYAIKDGAEGSRGWVNTGLPWILPTTTFDLTTLTDAFGDALGEASGNVPLALGVAAAAAGLGLLAFAEAETILQVLGSAALVQFVSKKLLFAEDRKETVKQFEELLNTKVAPKELVDDIQQIGKAILPALPVSNKGLPAPALGESDVLKPEATDVSLKAEEAPKPEPIAEATDVSSKTEKAPKPEPITEATCVSSKTEEAPKPEPMAEATDVSPKAEEAPKPEPLAEATGDSPKAEEAPKAEPIDEATDVSLEAEEAPKPSREEVEENSPKRISRPLSPYPNYSDYKPPSSPTPSPP